MFQNHAQNHFQNPVQIHVGNHVQNRIQNHVQNHVKNHVQNQVQNHVQNRVQSRVQIRVRNHVRKIKKAANNHMSVLKITVPMKSDFIVNAFLKIRQNIEHNFLSERVGYLSTQYELSVLFKPVTDMQKDLKEGL